MSPSPASSPQTSAPLPPDIQAQSDPQEAQSVFAQQGLNQPGPGMQIVQQIGTQIQNLGQIIQSIDKWAQGMKGTLDNFDPSLTPLLGPLAQAGMTMMQAAQDIGKAVQQKAQQSGMARGSSVQPQTPPQNPAAGPPNPTAQ